MAMSAIAAPVPRQMPTEARTTGQLGGAAWRWAVSRSVWLSDPVWVLIEVPPSRTDPGHGGKPVLLSGRGCVSAPEARLDLVDWGEGRAADLVVSTEDPVRHHGTLATRLSPPRRDQQRRPVEDRRPAVGDVVSDQRDDHREVEGDPERPGEANRPARVVSRHQPEGDHERRQRDQA